MNLQTHKQKSVKEKKIADINTGDVVIFKDPSATTDGKEQLGIVYRVLGRGGKYFAMAVLPLNAVSDADRRQNPSSYSKNDQMRLVLERGSKDVRELGVNANHYYTVGTSIRKYEHDTNIPDRDRFRVLPITADQTLLGAAQTVKCLGRAGADLIDKIDAVMTKKFRADPDTKIVFDDDVKNAVRVTLGLPPEEPKYQAVGMRGGAKSQKQQPVRMGAKPTASKPSAKASFESLATELNARIRGTYTPQPKPKPVAGDSSTKTSSPDNNKGATPAFLGRRWMTR